ncbi:MAG: polyhydroxyalkanoate synthesis repressor PhaR [Alphaproteobacteria bacterium]|nr:polyhydroxyalkanoate synthesis repressor PhaR [Alphaproteobacteria bacterium]
MTAPNAEPITIKKYANRRLYNTATSSYVTLDHLAEMVKRGQEFNVHDAKTGEDITRAVLTQIIFEEEGKGGQQLLPIQFLRQLIRFYGDSMQALVPGYLNLSMDSFSKNHERMREQLASTFGGKTMLKDFEGLARQNMAMFERTLRMFTPFGALMPNRPQDRDAQGSAEAGAEPSAGDSADQEIAELKAQLDAMRRQLDELANRK